MGIKNTFSAIDGFVKRHFVFIIVIVLGGYWLLHDTVRFPIPEPMYSMRGMGGGGYNYAREESIGMAAMDSDMAMSEPPMMKSGRIAYAEDGYDPNAEDRKIVKNANVSLEVGDTEEAKTLAEQEVQNLKGTVTNMNSWQVRPGVLGYNLTIRIPAENLETLMENLGKIGVKMSEGFGTQDITAAYQDTANRIANLEARRERLRELLEFETESLEDVLQVDRELSSVQLQIEQLQQTQNRRDVDVAYSTVNLNLQPETQIGDADNPYWSVKNSWKVAVNDLIQASHKIFDKALKIVVFIPIWLPILLIVWFVRRGLTKTTKKK